MRARPVQIARIDRVAGAVREVLAVAARLRSPRAPHRRRRRRAPARPSSPCRARARSPRRAHRARHSRSLTPRPTARRATPSTSGPPKRRRLVARPEIDEQRSRPCLITRGCVRRRLVVRIRRVRAGRHVRTVIGAESDSLELVRESTPSARARRSAGRRASRSPASASAALRDARDLLRRAQVRRDVLGVPRRVEARHQLARRHHRRARLAHHLDHAGRHAIEIRHGVALASIPSRRACRRRASRATPRGSATTSRPRASTPPASDATAPARSRA